MKKNTDDRQKAEVIYRKNLATLNKANLPFHIMEAFRDDNGGHPENFEDIECLFAAANIRRHRPQSILDIGSYRHFVKGLFAAYDVTSMDVRCRTYNQPDFTIVTGDAKDLSFPDSFFDAVISLCAIEHFGLGRYGDTFDIEADTKAAREFIRVLKPGGLLVFSTTIKRGIPVLCFNAHRIYSYEMINTFCEGLTMEDELFYSRSENRECLLDEIPESPDIWNLYCGAWRKT